MIALNGPNGVSETTYTDSSGFYQFTDLTPGTYTIREQQPSGTFYNGYTNTGTDAGVVDGTSGIDIISAINLNSGDAGLEYDFGEIQPTGTFGYDWFDTNRNGVYDQGSEPPIPGVAVTISGTAFAGTPLARPLTAADVPGGLTVTTNSAGRYDYPVLPPGVYTITSVQPTTFDGMSLVHWQEQNGDPTGPNPTIDNPNPRTFSDVVLTAGNASRGPFNFGETAFSGSPPTTPPIIVPPTPPSKRDFLDSTDTSGSSSSGAAAAAPAENVAPSSPGVNAAVADLPQDPQFAVSTGTPTVPAFVAVGAGPGSAPLVRVFNYATGVEVFQFLAYEQSYTGGVHVAVGDINGDGVPDIVTSTGVGGGPRVRVFSGIDGSVLEDFFAYEPTYTGGVSIAVGDVEGIGRDDIITGTETGGAPRISVFNTSNVSNPIASFFAFDSSQRSGVRIAAADFNGDGKADIVATTGPGVTTQVRVFSGADVLLNQANISPIQTINPFGGAFSGGAYIATGDYNGDGMPDIIVGADAGGGPRVQVFSGTDDSILADFFAYEPTFTGGVRVAALDVNGDGHADIIAGAGLGGATRVTIFSGAGVGASLVPNVIDDFFAFDATVLDGVYVGAGTSKPVGGTSPVTTPAAIGSLGLSGTMPPLS
ncbi:hypothetical protein FRUB_00841 [Fimbriiglobus ruber]|uniref:SD-repeat containing protein B domain-containing protein n=1 Tax=Fimbriiglobus ruber TaxID=1908690 RepID=A0A225E0P7_9BACT|nr:hypothetical protein FRUB_00841 [Fimbriiglobus ruber]